MFIILYIGHYDICLSESSQLSHWLTCAIWILFFPLSPETFFVVAMRTMSEGKAWSSELCNYVLFTTLRRVPVLYVV